MTHVPSLDLIEAQRTFYVLDSNVLIHDPNALLNFDEHQVVIPMTVLEELDGLKNGRQTIAADCRQVIRQIDALLGNAKPDEVERGVPIQRSHRERLGWISILSAANNDSQPVALHSRNNDNRILSAIYQLQQRHPNDRVVLVTKDINMRLKARGCGIESEDYQSDQILSDIKLLPKGFVHYAGSLWERVSRVQTLQHEGSTDYLIEEHQLGQGLFSNQFLIDEQGFVGQVLSCSDGLLRLRDLNRETLMSQQAWGLQPRDLYQALALKLLLDPEIDLVTLSGAAGSGKTILALAAAIEGCLGSKRYRRIIATRSTRGLDEEIGFLPGSEAEKMEPWLGAITDNLEALHADDESPHGSVNYILDRVPLQFKSLNYIRGRSFQQSFMIIDECQNLTPHQMKTIITRAGTGTKVVCLGNLAQIDTPYLGPISSGFTYLTQSFRNFPRGGLLQLQGVPRSPLAAFAEAHM